MELVELEENEWVFREPALTYEIENSFNDALDAYDDGQHEEAETLIRDIAGACPNHIDALQHLGVFLGDHDPLESYVYCQAAVAIGLQALPAKFQWETARLSWLELDNRPFMRAYHTLAVHRMDQGAWHDAIVILKRLVAVNPNDNQGARHRLPKCWFEVKDKEAVLDLCERYAGDQMPEILYSKALALALAKRLPEARAALETCIDQLPLVAKELLSRSHPEPKRSYPGSITVGGADQAWEYWKEYGQYWRKSKPAMTLLREAAKDVQ